MRDVFKNAKDVEALLEFSNGESLYYLEAIYFIHSITFHVHWKFLYILKYQTQKQQNY